MCKKAISQKLNRYDFSIVILYMQHTITIVWQRLSTMTALVWLFSSAISYVKSLHFSECAFLQYLHWYGFSLECVIFKKSVNSTKITFSFSHCLHWLTFSLVCLSMLNKNNIFHKYWSRMNSRQCLDYLFIKFYP